MILELELIPRQKVRNGVDSSLLLRPAFLIDTGFYEREQEFFVRVICCWDLKEAMVAGT